MGQPVGTSQYAELDSTTKHAQSTETKVSSLFTDDLQTDTPRLLSSPSGTAMLASPISSWSQSPRRPQADEPPSAYDKDFSPLCEGIKTPLISCLTLQPGTWGCNAPAATRSAISASLQMPPVMTSIQHTPYHTSAASLQQPIAMQVSNEQHFDSKLAEDVHCQQLDQQLHSSVAEQQDHLEQLHEAGASLQQQECSLAKSLEKQAAAEGQQRELQQVS